MTKWISVKERLPEEGQQVLMYVPDHCIDPGIIAGVYGNKSFGIQACQGTCYGWFDSKEDITHWAAFPEPPNE